MVCPVTTTATPTPSIGPSMDCHDALPNVKAKSQQESWQSILLINPANRLRSVVSPTTYFHPMWCRISSINSMSGQNTIIPNHCHKHHVPSYNSTTFLWGENACFVRFASVMIDYPTTQWYGTSNGRHWTVLGRKS